MNSLSRFYECFIIGIIIVLLSKVVTLVSISTIKMHVKSIVKTNKENSLVRFAGTEISFNHNKLKRNTSIAH